MKAIRCIYALSALLLLMFTLLNPALALADERTDEPIPSAQEGFCSEASPRLKREEPRSIDEDMSYIRVLITTGSVSSLSLKLYGAYYIEENMRPVVGSLSSPLELSISVASGKIKLTAGGKTLYTGNSATLNRVNLNSSAGYAQLFTQGSDTTNERKYLGNFKFSVNSSGYVRMVNVVPTAHYLYGIVPYEMSDSWRIDALMAQAVASKNYALGFSYAGSDYDISDSPNFQSYRGYKPDYPRSMQACVNACGKALAYDDEILMAFYGATNGGETALPSHMFGGSEIDHVYSIRLDDIDFDYAQSRRQTLEIVYDQAPDNSAFIGLLNDKASQAQSGVSSIEAITNASVHTPKFDGCERNMSNMTVTMRVRLSGGSSKSITVTFPVSELKAYGVFTKNYRSYWGETTDGGYNVYYVRHGHGVGLSQMGAQARALDGASYDEILSFYFDKMALVDVAELNPEAPLAYTKTPLAYGRTNGTPVNLRQGPGTDYPIIAQADGGEHVDIIGVKEQWYIVIYNGILGYMRADLVDIAFFPAPTDALLNIGNGITTANVNFRTGPSTYCGIISQLPSGKTLEVRGSIGDWYYVYVDGKRGFVAKQYVMVSAWELTDISQMLNIGKLPHRP